MHGKELVQRLWDEFEPLLRDQGYELVEIEYTGVGGTLRFYIDQRKGITLDDCAMVSRFIEAILDDKDWITSSYTLEVSSPGWDRPLRKLSDFERFSGEEVRIVTEEPIEGRKRFSGKLLGRENDLVLVECADRIYKIHCDNVHKANLIR
jgi:ribosome maturation factor RimP